MIDDNENLTPPEPTERASDMSSGMIAREKAPKKTWFFERMGDKKVFACEEKEAWETIYNNSTWRRRDFRLLGVSDGKTYSAIMNGSMAEAARLDREVQSLSKQMQEYQKVEHRLLVDEVVDMEDLTDPVNAANVEKVKRLRKIMNRLETQLSAKEKELKNIFQIVHDRAFNAELEKARGNIEMPSRVDIITPKAAPKDRKKILTLMEGRE